MTFRTPAVAAALLSTALVVVPAHLLGGQAAQAGHEQHHPAATQQAAQTGGGDQQMMAMMSAMRANDQKLDDLVKKMNAATGTAKVDAIANLLTTMVQDERTMHESMANMPMMCPMCGMQGHDGAAAAPKQ